MIPLREQNICGEKDCGIKDYERADFYRNCGIKDCEVLILNHMHLSFFSLGR